MRRTGFLATLALVALASGCASERPSIDRVQANALKKEFFVGKPVVDAQNKPVLDEAGNPIFEYPEFYMRGTVVDVGYGAEQDGLFTSTYAQPISRIKWEVTENFLNARLSYERIAGTDGKGNPVDGLTKRLKPSPDGQIVASYAIKSHFDVKRAYNPTTGEPLNVIEENSSDRVWYEREYFRVDWSQNHSTDAYDFDTLSMMGIYGSIEYEPLSYTMDPNHPDAPHFVMDEKKPDEAYFDVTNKVFAKPGLIDLSSLGWGIDKFPACMLPGEFAGGTQPTGNCNPVEITLRYSYKRVVDQDYEPIDHDGLRFQYIGAFAQAVRYGYERNYGMVDNQWFRFMSRYNIWDRAHYYTDANKMTGEVACATYDTTVKPTGDPNADANRDTDGNGTADECESVTSATQAKGSQCDIFRGRCTLPYAARVHKTIPWYVAGNTDEDLYEASNWAVEEWDVAMRSSVQVAKYTECKRTGGGGNCDALFPMWKGQQDDIDDAMEIARDVEACHRAKAAASTNEPGRADAWKSDACSDVVSAGVQRLASERGVATDDPNLKGIAAINNLAPVIVLCHNPVSQGDHPNCGTPVTTAPRQGDIRYNIVLHIDKPQVPSAWGIMVDADDPVTGEKVAASINIWTHITDVASQGLLDLVRYMNGELKTADITDGKYIREWTAAESAGTSGANAILSKTQVYDRLAASTVLNGAQLQQAVATPLSGQPLAVLQKARKEALDWQARTDVPSPSQAMVGARMQGARGTPFEAQLINQPMLQLAGISGNIPLTGALADYASPLGLNNPQFRAQLRQMKENALAKRGACILAEAPEASSLTGIADAMKRKFATAASETPEQAKDRHDKMFRYIKRKYHYAVIAHEMGHSIGLRHNFVSSFGSLFFRPQYWQLRTKNGQVTTECTDAVADGSNCVGPRWFDPMTAEEQNQLIWMFQQSSVMDYPGDVSQDTIGLGVTDFAAARFFYGDTVSYYTRDDIQAGTAVGVGITNATDTFGGLSGISYSLGGQQYPTDFHYSQLQNNYRVIERCYNVEARQPSWWREDVDGVWDQVFDGHIVSVGGSPTKCRQMEVDYGTWNQQRQASDADLGGGYGGRQGPSVFDMADGTTRLRVPYHFATDHWADTGNLSVFRHDNGADAYEQVQFLITTQENRHIFDNFRRSRTTFNVRAAADRSYSRYNEKLVGIAGGMSFYKTIYERLLTNTGYTFHSYWPIIVNRYPDHILAGTVAFDHLARELSRPEDGPHYLRDAPFNDPTLRSGKDPDDFTNCSDTDPLNPACLVIIPNGSTGYLRDIAFGGHPIENALDETKGDYSTEYTMSAGSYYDKINSIIHMSISEDRFISQSRGDFYDARFRANGLADIVPEGYRRVVANALTNDRNIMGPRLAADASGKVILDTTADTTMDPYAKKYPKQAPGWISWWPSDAPQVCFASQGRNACQTADGTSLSPDAPVKSVVVDAQLGWEAQKFVIAWVLAYIPANEKSNWTDMMMVYRSGRDNDPGFTNRLEFFHPVSGDSYIARTYGKECLFGTGATCTGGKLVQKGIAARIVEYANSLVSSGYKLDTTACPATASYPAGYNQYGRPCVKNHPDGTPIIVKDPSLGNVVGGFIVPTEDCDQNVDPACTKLTIYDNHWAYELEGYKSVLDYLWDALDKYQLREPHELGVYP
ncbi:MAG TPA: hypothetical protein VGQ83_42635 [Polyangia bacterium]